MSLGHKVGLYIYDDTSSEADKFEKIGRVMALSGMGISVDAVDATSYDDENDDFREYDYAMKDANEMTVTVRYRFGNGKAALLDEAQANSEKIKIKIVFPAPVNEKHIYNVLVTKADYVTEKEGIIEKTYTLKPSGKPEITATS